MNNPFLGELFGNSIKWRENADGLEIHLSSFESFGLPILILAFTAFFAIGSHSDGKTIEVYFSFIPLFIAAWIYSRGRRKIILNPKTREVELRVGRTIQTRIPVSNIPMSIQKTRVWDSQSDGPLYFTTHVLLLGDRPLLSVRSFPTLSRLSDEIRRAGFMVETRSDLVRANI